MANGVFGIEWRCNKAAFVMKNEGIFQQIAKVLAVFHRVSPMPSLMFATGYQGL